MPFKTYKQRVPVKKKQPAMDYDYRRKRDFVTPPELEFFQVLKAAVNTEHYYIVPQVHLSHLFEHRIKGQNWEYAFRSINQKSVDYIICTLKNLNPVCAIELDDSSHERNDRVERDKTVNDLFRRADLPLIRVGISEKDNIAALRRRLSAVLVPDSFKF